MIASNLFFRVFCLSVSGFITGCSFQDQISQSQFFAPKKQALITDKELNSEHIVTLLVGLKPNLGKGTSDIKSSPGLYLQSEGKPLSLIHI